MEQRRNNMKRELLQQAEQAVAQARRAGANDVIARVRDENSTEYTYRDGNIEQVQQSATRGLSIQLYVNGRYSSHQTTDLRAASVARFVEDAVALTQHLAEDPYRVDGLAGATITSRGVTNLLRFWLGEHGFDKYLERRAARRPLARSPQRMSDGGRG